MTLTATDGRTEKRYRTFWCRAAPAVVDFLVLLPMGVFLLWAGPRATSPVILIPLYVLNAGTALAYSVVLHARYGQTLGKRAAHVRVIDLSGARIGVRQAVYRDSPWLALALTDIVWATQRILQGKNPFKMEDLGLIPFALAAAQVIWLIAELITMLTNRRRRAVHDWIASTLVIRT